MKLDPDPAEIADNLRRVSAAVQEYGRDKASGASLAGAGEAAGPPPKRRRKLPDVLKAARQVGASRVKIDGYEIYLDPQAAEAHVNDFDRPPNITPFKRPRK
jgi:hypothetical protein